MNAPTMIIAHLFVKLVAEMADMNLILEKCAMMAITTMEMGVVINVSFNINIYVLLSLGLCLFVLIIIAKMGNISLWP